MSQGSLAALISMSSIESRVADLVRNLRRVSPTDSYSPLLSHHPGANRVDVCHAG